MGVARYQYREWCDRQLGGQSIEPSWPLWLQNVGAMGFPKKSVVIDVMADPALGFFHLRWSPMRSVCKWSIGFFESPADNELCETVALTREAARRFSLAEGPGSLRESDGFGPF